MTRTVVLVVATALAAGGGLVVFLRDLRFTLEDRGQWSGRGPHRHRIGRMVLEAAVPLVGLAALLSWAWTAL